MRSTSLMLLALTACTGVTGGERVTFDAVAVSRAPADPSTGLLAWIDPATGYEVRLSEAVLWTGPVYLWSDEPRIDVGVASLWELLVPTARASADAFVAGFLRGEVTTQTRVDLLAPGTAALGQGEGLAGVSRTGEVWLEPVATDVEAATVHARGVAVRGAEVVPFVVDATFDDAWSTEDSENITVLRRVRGLAWSAELTQGGTLTVGVDPRRWFDGLDFGGLADGGVVDAERPIVPGTLAGRVFFRDVRRLGVDGPWTLAFTP